VSLHYFELKLAKTQLVGVHFLSDNYDLSPNTDKIFQFETRVRPPKAAEYACYFSLPKLCAALNPPRLFLGKNIVEGRLL